MGKAKAKGTSGRPTGRTKVKLEDGSTLLMQDLDEYPYAQNRLPRLIEPGVWHMGRDWGAVWNGSSYELFCDSGPDGKPKLESLGMFATLQEAYDHTFFAWTWDQRKPWTAPRHPERMTGDDVIRRLVRYKETGEQRGTEMTASRIMDAVTLMDFVSPDVVMEAYSRINASGWFHTSPLNVSLEDVAFLASTLEKLNHGKRFERDSKEHNNVRKLWDALPQSQRTPPSKRRKGKAVAEASGLEIWDIPSYTPRPP